MSDRSHLLNMSELTPTINYLRIKLSRTHWQILQYLLRRPCSIDILRKELELRSKRAKSRIEQLQQIGFVTIEDEKYQLTSFGTVLMLIRLFNYHYSVKDKSNQEFLTYTKTYKEQYQAVKLLYALASISRVDLVKHLKHELTDAIKSHRYGLVKLKINEWVEEVLCLFNVEYEQTSIDNAIDLLASSILNRSPKVNPLDE